MNTTKRLRRQAPGDFPANLIRECFAIPEKKSVYFRIKAYMRPHNCCLTTWIDSQGELSHSIELDIRDHPWLFPNSWFFRVAKGNEPALTLYCVEISKTSMRGYRHIAGKKIVFTIRFNEIIEIHHLIPEKNAE